MISAITGRSENKSPLRGRIEGRLTFLYKLSAENAPSIIGLLSALRDNAGNPVGDDIYAQSVTYWFDAKKGFRQSAGRRHLCQKNNHQTNTRSATLIVRAFDFHVIFYHFSSGEP